MGWKTVIIGSEAKVSLSLNKLKIYKDNMIIFPQLYIVNIG